MLYSGGSVGLLNISSILCVITNPPKMLIKETKAAAAAKPCILKKHC